MKVSLIVATGKNGEIGKDNDLIWHLPEDMKFFKETTQDHIVIMGRRNWDSIPSKYRPLSGRENVVLTRTEGYKAEGAAVFNDLAAALSFYNRSEEKRTCFIIGGAQVYQLALDAGCVEEMYISHVDEDFDADTFFPKVDFSQWKSEVVKTHGKDEKNPYSFKVKRYWK
jgi:dihydrofolate reductase